MKYRIRSALENTIAEACARNPLGPFALAAAGGILISDRFNLPPALFAGFTLALLLSAFSNPLWKNSFFLLLITIVSFALLHSLRLDNQSRFPFSSELQKYPVISATAKGAVAERPRALQQGNRFQYTLKLDAITTNSQTWRTWHRIVVIQPGPPPNYGDFLSLKGELHAIRAARNPGEFSLDSYFARQGIVAELYVADQADVALLNGKKGTLLGTLALNSRDWIESTITRNLDDSPDIAAILRAMVLGDRQNTPDEIENSFRHSGALHIFAVSGLHVGIFGTIIWIFLKLIGMRRSHTVLIIIPALFFYAYVTGMRPSAFRAAIMASIFLGGFVFVRPPRLLNSLAAAALFLLAWNTQQLFLPGFQLSFCVLAFIALLASPIQKYLKKLVDPDPFLPAGLVPRWRQTTARIGRHAAELVAVSAAAWLGSAPLGLWHFHLVTPIAILANCALVPIAWLILVIASLSILSAAIGLTSLSVLFNNANWLTAHLLYKASTAFAALPGSHYYVDHLPSFSPGSCTVTVLDTGLGGGAQFFSLPNPRSHFLVDAGGPDTFFKSVLPFLRAEARSRLDGLIITHGDAQHLGGAVPLLKKFPPARISQSPLPNRSPYHRDFLTALATSSPQKTKLESVISGDHLFTSSRGDVSLRVLYPPANPRHAATADDRCLVLQLHSHSWRILLMADSGFLTEKWLLENVEPRELQSHAVIMGRHRSDYSGITEFLNVVRPDVVISTNFAFPDTEQIPDDWRKWLAKKNIVLLDQSQQGAVTICCTSRSLLASGYLTGEKFVRRHP